MSHRAENNELYVIVPPRHAPESSWWCVGSREEFQSAYRQQADRIIRSNPPRATAANELTAYEQAQRRKWSNRNQGAQEGQA